MWLPRQASLMNFSSLWLSLLEVAVESFPGAPLFLSSSARNAAADNASTVQSARLSLVFAFISNWFPNNFIKTLLSREDEPKMCQVINAPEIDDETFRLLARCRVLRCARHDDQRQRVHRSLNAHRTDAHLCVSSTSGRSLSGHSALLGNFPSDGADPSHCCAHRRTWLRRGRAGNLA